MTTETDRDFVEQEIKLSEYQENVSGNISSAWFILARCALRLFALFVDSYMKRDR